MSDVLSLPTLQTRKIQIYILLCRTFCTEENAIRGTNENTKVFSILFRGKKVKQTYFFDDGCLRDAFYENSSKTQNSLSKLQKSYQSPDLR